jgi:hypothetical protein
MNIKKEREQEEKGKEWQKGFKRHYMGEHSNFTWFNKRLKYQSPYRLLPYFGC